MDAFKNMLSPLVGSMAALHDTVKFVFIGAILEVVRRVSVSIWSGFIGHFFRSAHFHQEDITYHWMMHWLSKQPNWGRSREFEVTTRNISRHGLTTFSELDDEEEIVPTFIPYSTHTFYFLCRWFKVTRIGTRSTREYGRGGSLEISTLAFNNNIFEKLVIQAERDYKADIKHRVQIYLNDSDGLYGTWKYVHSQRKRPMTSIVLDPNVKDTLLADCKDFLKSEKWYTDRGIPFRRGYLLHGVPGSGKTSLVYSLAGELGLNIYVVSLSSKGMCDNTLTTLMGNAQSPCILLLEDLDAAFTRSVSRDTSSTGAHGEFRASEGISTPDNNNGSTLSLSGLLNSIDGVAAPQGRLLFITTNHFNLLDPALRRAGRIDRYIEFTYATKEQAEDLFKVFFLPSSPSSTNDKDASQHDLTCSERKSDSEGHSTLLIKPPEISELAARFARAIPEKTVSVAGLQGYLVKNKTRPRACVEEVERSTLAEVGIA